MRFEIDIEIERPTGSRWLTDAGLVERLSSCPSLPTPPGVAAEIIEVSTHPAASLEDISRVVQTDAALATRILAIVNSPRYARSRTIENLRQALALLGLDATLNLALTVSFLNSLRATTRKGLDYEVFWRRSLASAVFAWEIARAVHARDRESYFLAGLFQDIGMLALDQAVPRLYTAHTSRLANHEFAQSVEKEALGCDHSLVGAWLLEQWGLPEVYQYTTAKSHDAKHDGEPIEHPGYGKIARAVRLSNELANVFCRRLESVDPGRLLHLAQTQCALAPAVLVPLVSRAAENLTETVRLFELGLWKPGALKRIDEWAQELFAARVEKAIAYEESFEAEESIRAEFERYSRDRRTGLIGASHVSELIARELRMADHGGWPLSVLRLDLERFEELVEGRGRLVGEQLVEALARRMEAVLRESDILASAGEASLLAILPGTNAEGAERARERLVEAIEGDRIERLRRRAGLSIKRATYDPSVSRDHDAFRSSLRTI